MLSRAIYKKQRGRRPLTLLAVMSLVTGLLVASGTVLAVHDEDFQLDGNVLEASTTSIGGTQNFDWDSIFTAAGAPKATLPSGFDAAGFKKDFSNSGATFVTSDTSTYATGSKDTLPISGWQCNFDNNVNSKIDVMNAYSVSYTVPSGPDEGDEIMYFALERNTNTGDANVGFWFLQSAVGCTSTGGAVDFTGGHTDGDVLVVSAFSNGGTVSTINVYRWDGDDATGSLNTTPIGTGVDCRSATLPVGDSACAAANLADITVPWLTSNFKDKVGTKLRTAEFFEGGINLTDLDLGGKCFNTFIGDTRSSTSLTATLFDFASGAIGECTSSTVTTPKEADGITTLTSAMIPADGTLDVKDSALITVTGVDTFDATVSFSLCGPYAAASTTTCDSGGVAVGSAQAVTSTPSTVVSAAATITEVGRYCWRADFSGDTATGVPASSDHSATECFVVTPRQSTLSTQAGAGPVDLGQAVTDTATLGNTANQEGSGGPAGSTDGSINPAVAGGAAGGTITFTLLKNDCTTLATGTGTNPQTVGVSGNGSYGPVSFTPDAPGTYHWKASYDGDAPNTLGTTHNAACNVTAESVVVRQIPTIIATTPSYFPQDSATVTSSLAGNNLPANGTVTFSLYGATIGPDAIALANCQAAGATGLVYGPEAVLTGIAAHSATVGTNNTTFRVSASGTYYWLVTYAPGGTAHTGSQSNCVENINATLTGDGGPGSIFPTP